MTKQSKKADNLTNGDVTDGMVPGGVKDDGMVVVAMNRAAGIFFPMPDGRKVLVEGNATPLRGKEKGVLPVGAFGLTRVREEDWKYIERTYGPHMEIFASGLIFAQSRKADAQDCAAERENLRHGLEPADPGAGKTREHMGGEA